MVVEVVVVVLLVVVRVDPLSLYRRVNELTLPLYIASYVSYTWVYLYLSGRALPV